MGAMTTADPAALRNLVGAVLSRRFRLTKRIGDGGMGEVYAAEPVDGGTPIAVKILHPEFVTDPQVLARFLDEARVCERLIHPNIVRVYECLKAEDGSPYIAMELLDGVPLGAYTQNGGRVPVAQAIPILQGILAGLAAAHAQGIVHRDLKPDNVILTRDAHGRFVVKLLDFGIAKVMDVAGGMGQKTRTGMLLGTPAYMSPEQIKSAKDVDARTDLWSAGVMFYEMVTGRVAFPAPTEYARLAAVVTSNPEPVESVDPQLLPLGPFVTRALEKDRAARFQTALEMARALGAVAQTIDPLGGSRNDAPALSRLPDVAPMFAPSVADGWGAPPRTAPGQGTSPSPHVGATPETLATPPPGQKVSGTLASASRPFAVLAEMQPQVVVVAPHGASGLGETLPSQDLPMLAPHGTSGTPSASGYGVPRRGVGAGIVVLLVVLALTAGLLIGFAVGRM
jgi:eukaryotic-like serine/threonine-protein kinase